MLFVINTPGKKLWHYSQKSFITSGTEISTVAVWLTWSYERGTPSNKVIKKIFVNDNLEKGRLSVSEKPSCPSLTYPFKVAGAYPREGHLVSRQILPLLGLLLKTVLGLFDTNLTVHSIRIRMPSELSLIFIVKAAAAYSDICEDCSRLIW